MTCHIAMGTFPITIGGIRVCTSKKEIYEFVEIKAVNIGHRPVEITSAGLHLSNGKFITQLTSKMGPQLLPKRLNDGESVSINFDYDEIEKGLKKQNDPNTYFISAFVCDAEGREYKSKLPRILKERGLAKESV